MKLLLDTHIFLWLISGDEHLPLEMRDAILNLDNAVYLSVVSYWEIVVKYQLGKLPLPQAPELFIPIQRVQHQIELLVLDEVSVLQLPHLPSLHRDPFDRMLICQALAHDLVFITVDSQVMAYQSDKFIIFGNSN